MNSTAPEWVREAVIQRERAAAKTERIAQLARLTTAGKLTANEIDAWYNRYVATI